HVLIRSPASSGPCAIEHRHRGGDLRRGQPEEGRGALQSGARLLPCTEFHPLRRGQACRIQREDGAEEACLTLGLIEVLELQAAFGAHPEGPTSVDLHHLRRKLAHALSPSWTGKENATGR